MSKLKLIDLFIFIFSTTLAALLYLPRGKYIEFFILYIAASLITTLEYDRIKDSKK